MKVVVWTEYCVPEVLQLGEVEKPVPKDNEVSIRKLKLLTSSGKSFFPFSVYSIAPIPLKKSMPIVSTFLQSLHLVGDLITNSVQIIKGEKKIELEKLEDIAKYYREIAAKIF